ncbi:sugar phosphate nucleotidyltransferase [Pseudoroseicyclus aestuarii]|uniref:NDP-sugar pyrophosphorylase family protein n=1 Tax=Pseudoroseicyclus aestuarii TaxID=1795041 RepID=A0A318T6D9_9RHOB|nr:sugar phosphate nucleotidyltransferase [Pseudoroseicyclus aestuarii]PYE85994.1 NDP-sugar pyrophosphorylase family protein [Pseudoroseicyclus aestuarii]
MRIETEALSQTLCVLRLTGASLTSTSAARLGDACEEALSRGVEAAIVDLGGCAGTGYTGIAALMELYTTYSERMRLVFAGLEAEGRRALDRAGLTGILPLFDSAAQAAAAPEMQRHALSGTTAILLCAGRGKRMRPLSDETPKPMIDLLGRPMLERMLAHLAGFGIGDTIVNTAHRGDVIRTHFRESGRCGPALFFAPEGRRMPDGRWESRPLGTGSTLARLARDHAAFTGDVFVIAGDVLTDIDLADMARQHRASGADVTVAVAQRDQDMPAAARLLAAAGAAQPLALAVPQDVGVYLFKAEVLNALHDQAGRTIAGDLLPEILARGGRIRTYQAPFFWTSIDTGRDYYDAVAGSLRGQRDCVTPEGTEIRPGLWVMPGAQVSPQARIEGPCHIGEGAVIEAGAVIKGACAIGAHCIVEGRSVIDNSVIRPGTRVEAGAMVLEMIAGADWAVEHRFATGSQEEPLPLDMLSQAQEPAAGDLRATGLRSLPRIA